MDPHEDLRAQPQGGAHRIPDAISRRRTTACVGLACVVMLWLAGRGILNEATVSLQGDMPRYLLNGVFVHDFLRDHPVVHPLEYAYRYYARYPALSLGQHPPLLPVVEAPFFALFGVSVATGRVVILGFALLAVVAWFFIVRHVFDRAVAFAATMLFVTSPFVIDYARVVLSEIPALALMLVAVWSYLRYADTLRARDAVWFAVGVGLSAYAKQHTLFILPVLLVHLAVAKGLGAVFRRETIGACILIGIIIAPLVPMTLEFSRANVGWVMRSGKSFSRLQADNLLYYPLKVWQQLVSTPALVMAGLGVVACLRNRDRRVGLFILWIVGFYGELTYAGAREGRYAIYLIPPFLGLAAAMIAAVSAAWARSVAGIILTLIVVYQAVVANAAVPEFAEGYERAAQYVIDHPLGESVLYSANVDSGFFVFFVRKHDPDRDLVVLRADKILATSSLARIIADEIHTRDELYAMLQDYGVGYVVIEDAPYVSPALALLRTELQGPAFAVRERIPLRSKSARLAGVDLAIYEYLERQPARKDSQLRMRIPLMGGGVSVTFGDVVGGKPR